MTIVTDAPVVLAHDRPESAVRSSRKPNVIGCAVQLGAPDNDVCALRPLFTVIAAKTGAIRMDLHFVAHALLSPLSYRFRRGRVQHSPAGGTNHDGALCFG